MLPALRVHTTRGPVSTFGRNGILRLRLKNSFGGWEIPTRAQVPIRMFTTYVLESLHDGKHYTGFSEKPVERLRQHNAGKVTATKSRRPFRIIFMRDFATRTEARAFEKYLKTAAGRRFLYKELKNVGGSLPA